MYRGICDVRSMRHANISYVLDSDVHHAEYIAAFGLDGNYILPALRKLSKVQESQYRALSPQSIVAIQVFSVVFGVHGLPNHMYERDHIGSQDQWDFKQKPP